MSYVDISMKNIFWGGAVINRKPRYSLVCFMIRLIGVLSEGGISVQVKSDVATKGDMLVGALIEATKSLSSAISTGTVLKLEFREQKLLMTESEKGYTIVALVDRAEDYMDTLIRIIAEDIDSSMVPYADGVVTDLHKDLVTSILDSYVKHDLNFTLSETLEQTWKPILNRLRIDSSYDQMFDELEKTAESSELEANWEDLVGNTRTSVEEAKEYVRNGEFDKACAATFRHEDPNAKLFALKMGTLALTMTKTKAPPKEVLRNLSESMPKTPVYQLGKSLVGRVSGEISPIDYNHSFDHTAKSFEIDGTEDRLLQSFMFLDPRIGEQVDYALDLRMLFESHGFQVVCNYMDAVIERNALFQKLYSMTSMDDFKDELGLWKIRIGSTIEILDNVIKMGDDESHYVERIRAGLTGALQLQNYITLLTAIAESPVLTIGERRGLLREVISLYNTYFKKLLRYKIPLFSYTVDSVFQSISVAYAEYVHLATGNEKDRILGEIVDFLRDIVLVLEEEWSKLRGRLSLDVFMNSLSPVLSMAGELHQDEIKLILTSIRTMQVGNIDALRILGPMTFATNVGNVMMALASLSIKVLDEDERANVLHVALDRIISVHKYMMTQGVVCRDDIIALTYLVSESINLLNEGVLKEFVSVVEVLNRVSLQDLEKYDYEVAMMGDSLLRMLVQSWKRLKDDVYRIKALEILEVAMKAWKKYGFHDKAKEFEKTYGNLLTA
jgi:hypothetical protein